MGEWLLSRRDRQPGTKCLGSDAERPRPGGTVEGIVTPQIFVVETELMPLQKRPGTPVESSGPMMFYLLLDVMNGFWQLREGGLQPRRCIWV
jgi:hypothetical protein